MPLPTRRENAIVKTYKYQIVFFLIGLVSTLLLWRILIPIGLLLLLYNAVFFWPKLSKLKEGSVSVIQINKGKKYAIPVEVLKESGQGWVVKAVRPELGHSTISFVEQTHPVRKIRLVNEQEAPTVARQVSAPVKELYGDLEAKLAELKRKIAELERIEALVRSSEIYAPQAELYARALRQLHSMVEDGYALRQKCKTFIRETLIGAEISKLEPTTLPDVSDWKIEFQEKYKAISSQYQTLNDEVEALVSLQKEANL